VDVKHADGQADGLLRRMVQWLSPDATGTIPVREKIEKASIGRPEGPRVHPGTGDTDPVAFRRWLLPKRRNKHRMSCLNCGDMKSNPTLVGRKDVATEFVGWMLKHRSSFAGDDIQQTHPDRPARVIKQPGS